MTPPQSLTSDSGKRLLTFTGAGVCLNTAERLAQVSAGPFILCRKSPPRRPISNLGRAKPEPPAPPQTPRRINQVKQVGKELLVQSDSSASLHPLCLRVYPPPPPWLFSLQNHGVRSAVSDPQLGLAGSRRRHGCGENRRSLKSQPLCSFFFSFSPSCARVRVCPCLCLIGPPGDLTILLRCRHEPAGPGGRSAPPASQLFLKGTTVNRQMSSDGGG